VSGILASLELLQLSNSIIIYILITGLGVFKGLFAAVNAVFWPRFYGRKHLGTFASKVMNFLVIVFQLLIPIAP
jgi:OFA family oxalate/formate antiporter-like MFS transporter